MMNKFLCGFALVAAIALATAGCSKVFYPKDAEIEPAPVEAEETVVA
ncbi:MAG: hypothetical protein LBL35_06770 [Clostridiales bacterium]|jgi:hypothetical protein|nr:hypothetical protein [Clostridiales bacterium]